MDLKVDQMKGPCYRDGIIVFYFEGSPVGYGKPHGSESLKYNGVHHIDIEDLADLQEEYPDIIPNYDNKIYRTLTGWGYAVEDGLCELMQRGLLRKQIFQSGQPIQLNFSWIGPKWNAAQQRKRR